MKETGHCPECQSTDIYYKVLNTAGHGTVLLPFIGHWQKGVNMEVYVCGQCGYYQLFVPQEALSEVAQKYERRQPPQ